MNALQFLNHGLKGNNKGRSTYAFMNKKDFKSKRDKLIKRINKIQMYFWTTNLIFNLKTFDSSIHLT